jgi:LPS-assembly protein
MARLAPHNERPFERARLKWAAAAAALLACAPGGALSQAPDTTTPAPAPAQGEQRPSVVLEADRVVEDRDTHQVIADGNVEASYGDRTLKADRLIYDTEKRTIRAQGNVQILDADGTARFAEEVEVDESLSVGVATSFSMRIPGGGTAAASSAYLRPDGVRQLNRVVYTACPVCKDGDTSGVTWTLKARQLNSDPKDKKITYRDVVLQFRGVPLFYLPYFSHPDTSKQRQSGLLFPDIGQSERVGAYYQQPIYWAISPYQDLTVAPRLMTKVNPLYALDYRKRFWSGQVEFDGSVTQEADFDGSGTRFGDEKLRGHVFGSGSFVIDDYWQWGFNVAAATDDLYIKRYDVTDRLDLRAPYGADLTRLFSQVRFVGQGPNTYIETAAIGAQGLRDGDTDANLPKILPRFEYNRVMADPFLDGQLKFQVSSVNLVREAGIDSARVSGGAEWEMERVVGPGVIVSPFAQGRTDYYRVSNYLGATEDSFSRSVGLAGVEVRYPFMRPGRNVSLIIEPIITATAATTDQETRIPNEDSLAFELDDSNIFRPNVAPNYDLWESGERVAAGVRASAIMPGGTLSGVFGRRWKTKDDPQFRPTTNLDSMTSDYVGQVAADLGRHFGGDLRFRLDDESLDFVRFDAGLRAALWRLNGTARYFNVQEGLRGTDPSKELTTTIGYQITDRFHIGFGLRRDLDSAINLSQEASLTYRDDCTFVEFLYRRSETYDRSLGPTEAFQIRIGLSTLGVFGSK